MITAINSRGFCQHVSVGIRQQVAVRSNSGVSKSLVGKVAMVLSVSLFLVFALSWFMERQIVVSGYEFSRLQNDGRLLADENIALLAQKSKLLSRDYVVSRAGERFQLFVPENNQIQKLY